MLSKYLAGFLDMHEGSKSFWSKEAAFLTTVRDELSFGTLHARPSDLYELAFSCAERKQLDELVAAGPTCSVPDFEYIAGALDTTGSMHKDRRSIGVRCPQACSRLDSHLLAFGAGKRGKHTFNFHGEKAVMLLEFILPYLRLKRDWAEELLAFYHKHHVTGVADAISAAPAPLPPLSAATASRPTVHVSPERTSVASSPRRTSAASSPSSSPVPPPRRPIASVENFTVPTPPPQPTVPVPSAANVLPPTKMTSEEHALAAAIYARVRAEQAVPAISVATPSASRTTSPERTSAVVSSPERALRATSPERTSASASRTTSPERTSASAPPRTPPPMEDISPPRAPRRRAAVPRAEPDLPVATTSTAATSTVATSATAAATTTTAPLAAAEPDLPLVAKALDSASRISFDEKRLLVVFYHVQPPLKEHLENLDVSWRVQPCGTKYGFINEDAAVVLRMLLPYLREKHKEAELALEGWRQRVRS